MNKLLKVVKIIETKDLLGNNVVDYMPVKQGFNTERQAEAYISDIIRDFEQFMILTYYETK